jgi:peptidoglycan/LPS O-acetylase OafA/YrhL
MKPSSLSPRVASPDRLPALDGLRGLAILLVLFHHLFVFSPSGAAGQCVASVVEFASHGVDLFFALSGFLIARQLAQGGSTPGFARRFWVHRGAKILPLYLLVVLGVFVALKPLLAFTGHDEKLRWLLAGKSDWPWYLFFVSNVHNALDTRFTNPALDVSWSLAVEVQFYLLVFFMARWVAPARWARCALIAIAAAIVFRTAAVLAGTGWLPILVLTPGRLDAFGCGVLAAMAPSWLARCPAFLILGVCVLPVLVPWSRASPAVEIAGYTLVALAAGVAIERASRPSLPSLPIRLLMQPAMTTLGRISYSIYLTHLPLRAALRDSFLPPARQLDTPLAWLLQAVFWLGAGITCVLAGWVTWRFLEEPARQAIVGLLQSKRPAPRLQPA